MFWHKSKKQPEEYKNLNLKIEKESKELNFSDIDYITEGIKKALNAKTDPIVRFIVQKIKNDKKFFEEFMNSFKESEDKREILLKIIKANLIESCRKIFS